MMIPLTPENKRLYREEYGKALSCCERALLYSDGEGNISYNISEEFPLDTLNNLIEKNDTKGLLEFITVIYARARSLLVDRLGDVSDKYTDSLKWSFFLPSTADRNPKFVTNSWVSIHKSFKSLSREMLKDLGLDPTGKILPDTGKWLSREFELDWELFNTRSLLLIGEITHLCGRIDTLKQMRYNQSMGWLRIVSLIVALTMSYIGTARYLSDGKEGLGKDTPPRLAQNSSDMTLLELGKLSGQVLTLQKTTELSSQHEVGLHKGHADKLNNIQTIVNRMEQQGKITRKLTPEQFTNYLSGIELRLMTVSSQLATNNLFDLQTEQALLEQHKHDYHGGHRNRFLGIFWF